MADGSSSVPMEERQAPPLTADWTPVRYFVSSGAHFQNGVAPASFVHAVGGDQFTVGAPFDVSSVMTRIGMIPAAFEMPEGAYAATGFDAIRGVPAELAMAQQQLTGSNGSGRLPAPPKSSWTEEEDSILKHMVVQHGERKWSVIAQCLPGRIGKQCRERWINHLRPDIKQNDIWSEEDDRLLINAHRHFGNRWSSIAKHISGRSENAVKNHWNATLRSLKAKRRLKKKKSEQAPPGQYSALEEYIRSLYLLEDGVPPEAPPPSSTPPHFLAYDGSDHPAVVAPAPEVSSIPATNTEMMSFHGDNSAVGSSNLGMINLNVPPQLPDLNTTTSDPQQEYYYMNYPVYVPAPPEPLLQLATHQEDTPQSCSSLDLFPYADYFALLRTDYGNYHEGASSSNPSGANGYYYSEARRSRAAGGSGGRPAGNTDNVV